MNEQNILADVAVPMVSGTFYEMYQMQTTLQDRLKQLPPMPIDYKHTARKSIYWSHCIAAEAIELLEWLESPANPDWLKEMQMEAIDIVHFVFNLGIELGLTADDIYYMESTFTHSNKLVQNTVIEDMTQELTSDIVNYIDKMPWKTWKTYNTVPNQLELRMHYSHVLHVCLALCNACSLDRQEIINMYYAKNNVNHVRQDTGY